MTAAALRTATGAGGASKRNANRGVGSDILHSVAIYDKIEGNKNASASTLASPHERHISMSNQIVPYGGDSRQPTSFDWNGYGVTIKYDIDNNPWFDGPESCKAIGISNPSDAYARLDDDEKTTLANLEPESRQSGSSRIYVSESGLYNLVFMSRKADAKAFKKHVTSVVLPSIRKTGAYIARPMDEAELLVMLAQQNLEAKREIEAIKRNQLEIVQNQAQQAISIEAITDRLDDRDFLSIEKWCKSQGIKEGMRSAAVRQRWGIEASALSRARGVEIKKALDEPHMPGRYHVSILRDVCIPKPRTNGQMRLDGVGR